MPQASNRDPSRWIPFIGLALTLSAFIYQGGALSNKLESQETRIVKLEASQALLVDRLTNMDVRGAKNEQKLDFLVEQARDSKERRP